MKKRSIQSWANTWLCSKPGDRESFDIIGLNSGTSGDGLDIALVRFQSNKAPTMLFAKTYAYPSKLRDRIIAAGENAFSDGIEWLKLDAELGVLMGRLTQKFIAEIKAIKATPCFIASHGQTVRHLPSGRLALTLQIGEPSYIAKATGLPVVYDFRRSDLAAGGQGAPLSPVLHEAIFSHKSFWRAIVNIGGIANITILPPSKSRYHPLAADCGPGNMLIDMAMKKLFSKSFDNGGKAALIGHVDMQIVQAALANPFFKKRPPKSTGRELFGENFLNNILSRMTRDSKNDQVATISEITVAGITDFISRFGKEVDEIYLCGGGAKNRYILSRLTENFSDKMLATTAELGYDPDYLEALLWAFMAYRFMTRNSINTRYFTGAAKSYIPGKLCLP